MSGSLLLDERMACPCATRERSRETWPPTPGPLLKQHACLKPRPRPALALLMEDLGTPQGLLEKKGNLICGLDWWASEGFPTIETSS